MKLYTKVALGLIASVFAAGVASAADRSGMMYGHHATGCNDVGMMHGYGAMGCDEMGMMYGKMMDPAAIAHKHLIELKAELKITRDQEPAWQAFSDKVNAQAKNMASMHDKMRAYRQDMAMTAPARMDMMAAMMQDRAQNMAAMADAVKSFYATLTPEQKMTFDKMHMRRMKSDEKVK
ncbi:MAG: Spy/CpxP family protein refolding chaperone [Pseudomonadota bacterium]